MELTLKLTTEEMRIVIEAILEKNESLKFDKRLMMNSPSYLRQCKKYMENMQSILNKLPADRV